MASKTRDELFDDFLAIKKKNNLRFYDTHTHPIDVFGIVGPDGQGCPCHTKPSLLEQLKYNNFSLAVLKQLFFYLPTYIKSEIAKKYKGTSENEMVKEIKLAAIDKGVILPIYPHASPERVFSKFQSLDFLRLGSVDFSLSVSDIEKDIINQIKTYLIIGIKLHPNIQHFYPDPDGNDVDMKGKLEMVYRIAKEHKLYLLFHGGLSFVPDLVKGSTFHAENHALLKNFILHENFLKSLNVPVVIAHMGIYNVINPDLGLFEDLVKIPNVYFDTAGINPKYVGWFVKKFSSEKLLFGSDMPYFNLKFSIKLILDALYQASREDFEKNVVNVFSKNFEKVIS